MKRALAGVALVLAVGATSASASTSNFFQTPSRNIGCIYVAPFASTDRPYLRCDIGGGLHPLPPRPKSCDLDWGYGYAMFNTGPAKPFCAGDTAHDPKAPILQYGRTWRKGPFTCTSRERAALHEPLGARLLPQPAALVHILSRKLRRQGTEGRRLDVGLLALAFALGVSGAAPSTPTAPSGR